MNSDRLPEEKFLYAALAITLTAGSGLGAWFLANAVAGGAYGEDTGRVIQIHAHAQLFGWAALFIMGMAYVIFPRFKATPIHSQKLVNATFWLMFSGVVLWIVIQSAGLTFLPLIYAAPLLEALGTGLFTYNLWRTFSASGKPDFWDKWIKAGFLWLVGLSAFGLRLLPLLSGRGHLPEELTHTYYNLVIYGFILNFIMGVGLRTIPAFLGARPANPKITNLLFWIYNIALLGLAGTLLAGKEPPEFIMKPLELIPLASIAVYIIAINVFRRRETDLGEEFSLETSYMSYLPAAYFWLAVGVVLSAVTVIFGGSFANPETIEAAATHAVTVGFISMMIFGYATKAVPVFKGRALYSPALNNLAFLVLNFGNALRVVSQLSFGLGSKSLLPVLAASGIIELTAFILFAYNLGRTTLGAAPVEDDEIEDFAAITGKNIVADVLERHPETMEVFLRYGFTPLTNPVSRRTVAKTITLTGAARLKNIDSRQLVNSLNECIKRGDNRNLRAV